MDFLDRLRGGLSSAGKLWDFGRAVANPTQTLINGGLSAFSSALPTAIRTAPDTVARTSGGRLFQRAMDATAGAFTRDVAKTYYRLSPESIHQEAQSTGRTFWSVFEDRLKTEKTMPVLARQLELMGQGMTSTQARQYAMDHYVANPARDSEFLGNVADFVQPTMRGAASLPLSATNFIMRRNIGEITADMAEKEYGIPKDLYEATFGKESIKTFDKRANEARDQYGIPKSIAYPGIVALTALDLSGTGAGKKGVTTVAEHAVPEVVEALRLSKNLIEERNYLQAGKQLGLKDNVAKAFQKGMESIVDFTAPIERRIIQARKAGVDVAQSAYNVMYNIGNSLRATTLGAAKLTDWGIPQLVKDIERNGHNVDDFGNYMLARRVMDLEKKAPGSTGQTPEQIANWQKMLGMSHIYEQYAPQFIKANQNLLDYSVESGLVSKELAAELKAAYGENYVPMARVFSVLEQEGEKAFGTRGVGGLSRQTVVRKMEGSERVIEDPLSTFIHRVRQAVIEGEKNKAGITLTNYHNLGEGDTFGLVPIRTAESVKQKKALVEDLISLRKENDAAAREIPRARKNLVKINKRIENTTNEMNAILEEAKVRAADFENESELWKLADKAQLREKKLASLYKKQDLANEDFVMFQDLADQAESDLKALRTAINTGYKDVPVNPERATFNVLRDGIQEVWEADKDVVTALKGLNEETLNTIQRMSRGVIRVLKVGTTGISLPFVAANIVRDFMTGLLNRPFKETPLEFLKTAGSAAKSAITHDAGYDELIRLGAGGTSFDITRDGVAPSIELMRAQATWSKRLQYMRQHPIKEAQNFLRFIEDQIGRSEELGRLMNYYGAKKYWMKLGFDEHEATIRATMAARETTADFFRRGSSGALINSFIPYFNAGIQGTRASIRAMKANPKRFATKVAIGIGLPYAVAMYNNMSDPKKREVWKDIPEWEKRSYIIWIPDNPEKDDNNQWKVYKVPLTPNVGAFAAGIRSAMETIADRDPSGLLKIGQNLAGTVSPIDPSLQGLLSTTPQYLKPMLEVASNYNTYTGQRIIPGSMEGLNPEDQYMKGQTSYFSRQLGGLFDYSGAKVDHLIKGYFGSDTARLGMNAYDRILAATGMIDKEDVGGRGIADSMRGRFLRASGGDEARSMNETLNKYAMDSKSADKHRKDAVDKIMKAYKDSGRGAASELIQKYRREFPGIGKDAARAIEDDKLGLTQQEKRVKSLGVRNGIRAQYIYEQMMKLSAGPERKAYLRDLQKKKILTKDVYEQLMTLKVNERLESR